MEEKLDRLIEINESIEACLEELTQMFAMKVQMDHMDPQPDPTRDTYNDVYAQVAGLARNILSRDRS